MSDKKDQNLTDKEVNMKGVRDEGKTYIDGQGREMIIHSEENKKEDIRNPLVWVIPIMVVILIIPLMIFHIGGDGGGDQTADTGAETEESSDDSAETEEPVEGEEGAEEEAAEDSEEGSEDENGASSGDADAEGVAQNSCASCHGEDFSGGMGPALAGTSLSEEDFTDIVRNGQGSMPAFDEDQISDEELTAMYDMWSE